VTVSELLEQLYNKSDNIKKVVANLEQALRTQLVDDLLADLLLDVRFATRCETRKNLTACQQDVFALLVPSC
jgi:hypothetical protein